MIVLLRHDVTQETSRELVRRIRDLDLDAVPLDLGKGRALEVVGDDPSRVLELAGAPGVQEILTRRTPLAGGEPIWPHFVIRVAIATLLLIVGLAVLTAFLPPGLGDRAATAPTGGAESVEWYLRPLSALLHVFPEGLRWLGGWVVLLFWLVLFGWPFLDRADASTERGRTWVRGFRVAGVAALLLAIVLALGVAS